MPSPMLLQGAGLGLRRALTGPFAAQLPEQVDFLEVVPENWINVGGRYGRRFREISEHYPLVAHGLSLSIGSPAPLDEHLLGQLKKFLDTNRVVAYSDHLSFCSDHGHLYDLMPIPFTPEAVQYVAERIRRVQETLDRRIAMENISYYAAPSAEMSEIEFITAVLEEADCDLLLDVNNIYVNSINHRYDAREFLTALPAERVTYFHVAGHFVEAEDLRVDTHAAPVIDPVWDLLADAYRHFGNIPTLLERDFNIPPLEELLVEVEQISRLQAEHGGARQPARQYG
ncbi:MAG: HvfB family MNIO-type RiPP peptide maturase [Gammaproteobacteria bacterium]